MNRDNQICNQCKKHCSVNDLQCGKGKAYFESLNSQMNDGNDNLSETLDIVNRDEDKGVYSANKQDSKQNDSLVSLLHKCGHFINHKHGVSKGQEKILEYLALHTEVNQKELQDWLGIQSGSISEIVIKMENKGLLKKIKDETDKRGLKLAITELGLEHLKETITNKEFDEKQLFQSLSENEQEILKQLLTKLKDSWISMYFVDRESKCKHHEHGHDQHCERGHVKHEMHFEKRDDGIHHKKVEEEVMAGNH